jgi:hypothetical protein
MSETYKAIGVRKPGEFSEVRRPLRDPGNDQVRIAEIRIALLALSLLVAYQFASRRRTASQVLGPRAVPSPRL